MKLKSKIVAASIAALVSGAALAAGSPGVERNTQAFLEALAKGGQPIETLAPGDAHGDACTTDPKQRQEIYTSPLRATPEQLKGLPPTLVQTAEKDVLWDEGEAYSRKLDGAGVTVVATRYNGMIHDFGLLNVLSELPATRTALHQASEELKLRLR